MPAARPPIGRPAALSATGRRTTSPIGLAVALWPQHRSCTYRARGRRCAAAARIRIYSRGLIGAMTMSDIPATTPLVDDRIGFSKEALKHAFLDNLFYIQGKFPALATKTDYYMAL